jgi:two-component system response regulator RpaA
MERAMPTLAILIADPERQTRERIAEALRALEVDIILSTTALSMLRRLWEQTPEILVLTDGLEGIDKLEICKQVRNDPVLSDLLIMLLQDPCGGQQTALALDAGADDCMSIHFDQAELAARIRALARRTGWSSNGGSSNGSSNGSTENKTTKPLKLVPEVQGVRVLGQTIPLAQIEYRILGNLYQAAGSVVKSSDLVQEVWTGSLRNGSKSALRTHIRNLRKKIETDPSQPVYLRTLHGFGYYLRNSHDDI